MICEPHYCNVFVHVRCSLLSGPFHCCLPRVGVVIVPRTLPSERVPSLGTGLSRAQCESAVT